MSGLEVLAAVAAVVSAFHGGAELVAHIKKKHHRRRSSKNQSQQEFEEKQLQDSLETGGSEVIQRYTADIKEFGDVVRIGDSIARDRLLHIVIVLQAEVIRSLQLAVKYENSILNLHILHEASIVNRRDTITTLDELKQRIMITRPLSRTLPGMPEEQRYPHDSSASVRTYRTVSLPPLPDDHLPSAITIPGPEDTGDSKSGLAKYFHMRRNNSQSSTSKQHRPSSSSSGVSFVPALNYLLQGSDKQEAIMKDIDDMIGSYQDLQKDTWAMLDGGHGGPSSRRDTLALLTDGDYKRDSVGLNRDSVQSSSSYPPPGETSGNRLHPNFDQNIFDHRQAYNRYFGAPDTLSQHQGTTQEARWSQSSSLYSDTVPPSMYSHDSRSSQGSALASVAPYHTTQSSQGSPTAPFAPFHQPRSPPPIPSTAPQHTRTSPIAAMPDASFAALQRHQSPIEDGRRESKGGKSRVHFIPEDHAIGSSSIDPRTSISMLASTATSVAAASTLPPQAPPQAASQVPYAHLVQSRSNSSSTPNESPAPTMIRTNTIQGPIAAQQVMMSGRPCKKNNYWGFCKGAWAVRETQKNGLALETRPDGMYNSHRVWQCKECYFQGDTFSVPHPTKKGKRETVVDPNVHGSASGIRYRWIFLAKSHVRKKTMESGRLQVVTKDGELEECNYGCVICSVEGNVTGIYGNVSTLMNHIFHQHGRNLDPATAAKSKCIVGREPGAHEDWDLIIPRQDEF